jgi:hypothetical protein
MKTNLLTGTFLLLLTLPAMAQDQVKSCSSTLPKSPAYAGSEVTLKVVDIRGSLIMKMAQIRANGTLGHSQVPAKVISENVRPGITNDLENNETLNMTETFIRHAYSLTQRPENKGFYSAGLDLKKIRSATVYHITRGTQVPAIIEARDESDKDLGTFLITTMVTPCK